MAFVDALIAACDADVVMVDRRHRPGGHWNNADRRLPVADRGGIALP
jgi:hypothetical protein